MIWARVCSSGYCGVRRTAVSHEQEKYRNLDNARSAVIDSILCVGNGGNLSATLTNCGRTEPPWETIYLNFKATGEAGARKPDVFCKFDSFDSTFKKGCVPHLRSW
jgi:hypothetical protein